MILKRKVRNKKARSPFIILLSGFALLILIGTLLLMLPFATKSGVNLDFIDAMFLSTSAVCVTGLVSSPLPLSMTLSPFGIIVLWFLIEIGGLGFITLVTFAFSFAKKKVNISTNVLLKEAMNQNNYQELIPLGKKIVITSFGIQLVGIVLNFFALLKDFKPLDALGYSIFHTASSFNNAGFDIFGSSSLELYKNNIPLMIITSLLIILGGLGFVVMFDVFKKRKYSRLNLHTKVVINATILILVVGTILIKVSDWNGISWGDSILQVIFARTAGFATINLASARNTILLILMVIMFIGGSPASIAGGVKTTTFYTIIRSIGCFGRGKKHIISHNREINQEAILKSYVLVTVSIVFIGLMSFLILFFEETLNTNLANHPNLFKEIIFEAVSAFATCGTTLGITSKLSSISKCFIIILMYFGRLGPITFISLLNKGNNSDEEAIRYVEGEIIIG